MKNQKRHEPGKSHNPEQPVQYVPLVNDGDGHPGPGVYCRTELICTADGAARAFVDDGYSQTREGRLPHQGRATIERCAALHHDDGTPMFVTRRPLAPWESGHLRNGRGIVFDPPAVPMMTPEIQAKIEDHLRHRAGFLGSARGHAGADAQVAPELKPKPKPTAST